MSHPQDTAIAHVAMLAAGGPADPSWRVTLHFHPDRLVAGTPILQLMTQDGVYRSQFETGTGNGGLTARPGGDRWRWESRIFAAAYDNGPAAARPKYGSMNFRRRLACRVEWHGGFTLTTSELRRRPGYRGQEFVDLGLSLARDGRLDPRILGDASRTGEYDDQALKRVWHYVARFGSPEMYI